MPSDIRWSQRMTKSLNQFEDPSSVSSVDDSWNPHTFGLGGKLDNLYHVSGRKIVFNDYVHALFSRYAIDRKNILNPTAQYTSSYGRHQRDAIWEEVDYMMIHQETGGTFIVVSLYLPATLPSDEEPGDHVKTRTGVQWMSPGTGSLASRKRFGLDAWDLQPELVVVPYKEGVFPSDYSSKYIEFSNNPTPAGYSNAFSGNTGDGILRESESIYFGKTAMDDKGSVSNYPDTYPSGTFTIETILEDVSMSDRHIAPDLITTPYTWSEYENALKYKSEIKHTAGTLIKGKGYGDERYTAYEVPTHIQDSADTLEAGYLLPNGDEFEEVFGDTQSFDAKVSASLTGALRTTHINNESAVTPSVMTSANLFRPNLDGDTMRTGYCIEFSDILGIGQIVRYDNIRSADGAYDYDEQFRVMHEYFEEHQDNIMTTADKYFILASGPHLYLNPEQRAGGGTRKQIAEDALEPTHVRTAYDGYDVEGYDHHSFDFIRDRTEYVSVIGGNSVNSNDSDNILNYTDYDDIGERNLGTTSQTVVQGNWIFSPLRYILSHNRGAAAIGGPGVNYKAGTLNNTRKEHVFNCPSKYGTLGGPRGYNDDTSNKTWASYELAVDYIVNPNTDIRTGNSALSALDTEDTTYLSKRSSYASDRDRRADFGADLTSPDASIPAERLAEFGSDYWHTEKPASLAATPTNVFNYRYTENDFQTNLSYGDPDYTSTNFLNDIDYSTVDARTTDGKYLRDSIKDLTSFDSSLSAHSRALNVANIQGTVSESNSERGDGSEFMGKLARFSALPGQWKCAIDHTQGDSTTSTKTLKSVDASSNGFEGGGYWFHEKDNGEYVYPLFGSKTEAGLFGQNIHALIPSTLNEGVAPTGTTVEYKLTMHDETYLSTNSSEQKTFYMPANWNFTDSKNRPSGAHTANGYMRPKQLKCVYFLDNGDGTYTFPLFKSINSYLECRHDPAFYLGEAVQSYLEYDTDMIALKTTRYGANGAKNAYNYKFSTSSYPGAHPQNPVLTSPDGTVGVPTTSANGFNVKRANLNTTNQTRPNKGVQYQELTSATYDPQTISTIKDKHHRTWYVDNQTPHVINVHPRELISKIKPGTGPAYPVDITSRQFLGTNTEEVWWNDKQADSVHSQLDSGSIKHYIPITSYNTWERFQNVEEVPNIDDGLPVLNSFTATHYYYYDKDSGKYYYPLYKDLESVYALQLDFDTYFSGLGIQNYTGEPGESVYRGKTYYYPKNAGIAFYTGGTTVQPGSLLFRPLFADLPDTFGDSPFIPAQSLSTPYQP